MDDLVKRAREALDGVTKGPWELVSYPGWERDEFAVMSTCGNPVLVRLREVNNESAATFNSTQDVRFLIRARTLVPAMADRIEELEADVATALEALRFYANPDHWEPPYANPGENPFSLLDEDEGEVARVAIAQITGIPR